MLEESTQQRGGAQGVHGCMCQVCLHEGIQWKEGETICRFQNTSNVKCELPTNESANILILTEQEL